MRIYFMIILIGFAFSSCQNTSTSEEETDKKTKVEKTVLEKLDWKLESVGNLEDGTLGTKVSIMVNNQTIELGKVSGQAEKLDKASYSNSDVPEEAKTAVKIWMGDLETVFYAMAADTEIVVFEGGIDEGSAPDFNYMYKEVKRITIK